MAAVLAESEKDQTMERYVKKARVAAKQLVTADNATRENIIKQLVQDEQNFEQGIIWEVGASFAELTGARWESNRAESSFSTTLIFYAGAKEVAITYCGSQDKYVVTPSLMGTLLRYVLESKQ